ncbi:C39 family peptidase [Nocardioides sp.]|uniref:C39 family peptidase n=1 Tax=Nocardioides sp. TaxID=35761 RepID=UPI002ED4081F
MLPLLRRLAPVLALALVVPVLMTTAAEAAPARRKIQYAEWRGATLSEGRFAGTVLHKGRVRIAEPVARRTYGGTTYDVGRWVSPWHEPGFALTELIASWQATTPGNSWVEVQVRGRTAQGRRSSWDTLGRWAAGDRHVRRTSAGAQGDDLADVNVDTWQVPGGVTAWQLRISLMRAGKARPTVRALGAVASRLPDVDDVTTSQPGVASGRDHVVLDVPRYSQMVHSGHYPRWGGGGQAWCSPTSLSMVLGYHDALPRPAAYSWVPDGHPQPWVDHGARMTFDHAYDGTGNWPFNAAYAGNRLGVTGSAYVTRLRTLRQAERFVARGVPLVASISFGAGELDGAPISSTNGHLLVIVGFTRSGNVVVNDPAARRNKGVRRTYDRGQFEDAWLPTSGGVVYVVTRDAG